MQRIAGGFAVVTMLAILACGGNGADRAAADGAVQDTLAARDDGGDTGGWQECRHEAGHVVSYPAGWVTNDGSVMAECSLFDPRRFTVPEASEVPEDIAVSIHVDEVPYDRVIASDFAISVLDVEDVTVAGRRGVRRLVEHTGDALYERGMQSWEYIVDWGDGGTLIASSHNVGEPDFAEKRRVLDAMMERLRRS
jgi:hypothetical protein